MRVIIKVMEKIKTPKQHRLILRHSLIMFTVFCTVTVIFGYLAREVLETGTAGFDHATLNAIHGIATPALDKAMIFATELGGIIAVPLFALIIIAKLVQKQHYTRALLIAIDVAGAGVLSLILKHLFARSRPDLWTHLVNETTSSFPSSHAVFSSALALAVVFAAWHSRYRWTAIIIGSVYALLIAFTRLYLGVHYPTDIIAGWLLATAWVSAIWLIYHMVYSEKRLSSLLTRPR